MTDDPARDAPAVEDPPDRPSAGARRAGRPPTVQLGAAGRSPGILAAAVAVFLLLAIVKPWPTGRASPVELVRASPSPTAVPSGDPLELVHRECQDPPGWRTYTKERWSGGTLHVWMTVQPAEGHHAQIEDGLPTVPYATEVLGLGFCAPFRTAERPPDGATVNVWRAEGVGGATPHAELLTVTPAVAGLELPYGGLLLPPSAGSASDADRWAPGRYVFQVVGPGRGYERWWAVQIDPPIHPVTPDPSGRPDGGSATGG